MFGLKKKEVPVVEQPVQVKPEITGPAIRNCISCGARCSRNNNSSTFLCNYCGTEFTDEEAEKIAQRTAAAIQAAMRQNTQK